MDEMYFMPFVIDEEPYCLWDFEIAKLNLKVIESFNPKYFSVVAETFEPLLETEHKQYAAFGLRTYYSHGLETLFALIGATIQAPDCVIGWLLKYENKHLFSLIRKIQGYNPIYSRFGKKGPMNWERISKIIYSTMRADNEEDKELIIKSFAKLWGHFASDFLNETDSDEYNSIKHGRRIRMGGFSFAMGIKEASGEIVPHEKMRLISKSDFGSSFFITEKVKTKSNFVIHNKSVNGNPENFLNALRLISTSIENILVYLKIANNAHSSELKYAVPNDEGFYKKPWEKHSGSITNIGLNSSVDIESIEPISKKEILESYET